MNNIFGKDYCGIYDNLYGDKPYEKECDLLEKAFSKGRLRVKKVLDLGCGTARHDVILASRGYEMTGVDVSSEMLGKARQRASGAGVKIVFIKENVRALSKVGDFEAVISMFNVAGYQTGNSDILGMLKGARENLVPGGLFIFDCWNGDAVMKHKPQKCSKEITADGRKIQRRTEPRLDVSKQVIDIKFDVFEKKQGADVPVNSETHVIRYFFPREIGEFLDDAGFRDVEIHPLLDMERPVTDDDWNMTVIAFAG